VRDKVDSGMGLSGGPLRQPYAGVNYIPHSGTINLATGEVSIVVSITPFFLTVEKGQHSDIMTVC
jgi:hypothetical protein